MIARKPEECDSLFEQYMNAGDLDALVALYEPTATLVATPGEPYVGHAAIREALADFMAAKAQMRLRVGQILRSGDDLAVLYNDWSGHYTDADGARVEVGGLAMEIVRRQPDGRWLFAIDDAYARG